MLEFIPIKHGGGTIVDSKPQQKFEKADNCILECVQNAIDASVEKNDKRLRTILKFHFTLINKSDCVFFNKEFEKHLASRAYGKHNSFDESIPCLIMEDFSTTGISGDPAIVDSQTKSGDKNNWYYFLIDFGGANKLKDAKKGGSEGEGRQTFMLNSGIATFFGISIDALNQNRPSIFGMSYFGARTVDGVKYPVFSSFGKKINYEGTDECVPVTEKEAAEKFISLFNLKRTLDDSGTSIIIPFYNKEEITADFIIEKLTDIYRVPIFKDELEVHVNDTIINSENIRSIVDQKEENPNKRILLQDYFNFLEEAAKTKVSENNQVNYEINYHNDDDLKKEDITNFDNLIKDFNEGKLVKLKINFEIFKLKENSSTRYDSFKSNYFIFLKKYPSSLDNLREPLCDFIRGQMPVYNRRNKKTSMFHLLDIQDENACVFFKHAEQANHSEISAENWKLKEQYKNFKPIIRLTKNITVKLYNLITSENLDEDIEATQDLFRIEDHGPGAGGNLGTDESDGENEKGTDNNNEKKPYEKITHIVVPPIFEGLKPFEVSQKTESDHTYTLIIEAKSYNKEKISKKIEDAQKFLADVKKVDYSKYTDEIGRMQLEKMEKTAGVFRRRIIEYKNFLSKKCTFYPQRIVVEAAFEGEGQRNSIRHYKPQDFDFADKTFKLNLEGSIKLSERKNNKITLIASKDNFIFSINGFQEGIEDVLWRVRHYEE